MDSCTLAFLFSSWFPASGVVFAKFIARVDGLWRIFWGKRYEIAGIYGRAVTSYNFLYKLYAISSRPFSDLRDGISGSGIDLSILQFIVVSRPISNSEILPQYSSLEPIATGQLLQSKSLNSSIFALCPVRSEERSRTPTSSSRRNRCETPAQSLFQARNSPCPRH